MPVNPSCPNCGSEEVTRSRRRHLGERIVGLFGLKPYRCSDCYTRFFGRMQKEDPNTYGQRTSPGGRVSRFFGSPVVLTLLAAVLVGAVVVALIRAPTTPEKSLVDQTGGENEVTTSTAPSTTQPASTTTGPTTTLLRTTTTTSATTTAATTTSTIPTTTTTTIPTTTTTTTATTTATTRPTTAKPEAQPAAARSYTIQFGAFIDKANALALAQKLRQKGLEVRVVESVRKDGRTWSKVWVGSYQNLAQAQEAQKNLSRQTGLETAVVREVPPR